MNVSLGPVQILSLLGARLGSGRTLKIVRFYKIETTFSRKCYNLEMINLITHFFLNLAKDKEMESYT